METFSDERDFGGDARPQGRWPDPGAWEQGGTTPAPDVPVAFELEDVQDPLALGSGFNATVVAVSSSGEVAAGYRGEVVLSTSDEQAVVGGPVRFTDEDQGRHRLLGKLLLLTEGEH